MFLSIRPWEMPTYCPPLGPLQCCFCPSDLDYVGLMMKLPEDWSFISAYLPNVDIIKMRKEKRTASNQVHFLRTSWAVFPQSCFLMGWGSG